VAVPLPCRSPRSPGPTEASAGHSPAAGESASQVAAPDRLLRTTPGTARRTHMPNSAPRDSDRSRVRGSCRALRQPVAFRQRRSRCGCDGCGYVAADPRSAGRTGSWRRPVTPSPTLADAAESIGRHHCPRAGQPVHGSWRVSERARRAARRRAPRLWIVPTICMPM